MFSDTYQAGPSTETYQGIAAANLTRTGEIHKKFQYSLSESKAGMEESELPSKQITLIF